MHNEYKEFATSTTLDQQSLPSDLIKDSSCDSTILAVVNAAPTFPKKIDSSNENVLKIVHIQKHPEIGLRIITLKRLFDICFSVLIMSLGFPIFLILYILTKFSSPGPVFFTQERLGKNGRPFKMYKFRSMYVDAEKFGPQLSRKGDPRITKWGNIIRRTRLDELPQFWNVIKGDMSIVGPRPERQFFVNKIVQRNPNYRQLQRLKPGLTSLGQVEYGYAEDVDEMCVRMRYDLLYLDNISFFSDVKIILRTIRVMFEKKGV